jgi:hypothetical protein
MAKIIKNTTGSDIEIYETGITIPASGQVIVDPINYLYWSTAEAITEMTTHINAGDIVINDGVDDITVANGFSLSRAIDFLKYSDAAFHVRFASQPERMNGFVSKNVQEAIEESKAAIEGKVSVLPTFLNNGLTKNKWLALDGAMSASDSLPAVTAFNSKLAATTYVNDRDNTDVDLEFYKNAVLVFTWHIRNKRYAYKTDALSGVSFSQGDRISCFARQVTDHNSEGGDGTGVDPTSVIVLLNVQTINNITGEGGGSTL